MCQCPFYITLDLGQACPYLRELEDGENGKLARGGGISNLGGLGRWLRVEVRDGSQISGTWGGAY